MLPTPKDLVIRTTERDTLATITTTPEYLGPAKYSKKRPDTLVFIDGADLTLRELEDLNIS